MFFIYSSAVFVWPVIRDVAANIQDYTTLRESTLQQIEHNDATYTPSLSID